MTMLPRVSGPASPCTVADLWELAGDADEVVRRNATLALFDRKREYGDPARYLSELLEGFTRIFATHPSAKVSDIQFRFDTFKALLEYAPRDLGLLSTFLPCLLNKVFYPFDTTGTTGTRYHLNQGVQLLGAAARLGTDMSPVVEEAMAMASLLAPGEHITRTDLGAPELVQAGKEVLDEVINAPAAVPALLQGLRTEERLDEHGEIFGYWPPHLRPIVGEALLHMSEKGWLETRRALRTGIHDFRKHMWMRSHGQGDREAYTFVVETLARVRANLHSMV